MPAAVVAHADREPGLVGGHLDLEHAVGVLVGVHDDVRARLGDRHLHVGQHGGVEGERVGHPGERLPHDRDALGARGHRQADVGRARSSAGAVPFGRRALDRGVAAADHRQDGHEAGDVEDALHARLDGLADADDEALAASSARRARRAARRARTSPRTSRP